MAPYMLSWKAQLDLDRGYGARAVVRVSRTKFFFRSYGSWETATAVLFSKIITIYKKFSRNEVGHTVSLKIEDAISSMENIKKIVDFTRQPTTPGWMPILMTTIAMVIVCWQLH